VRESVDGFDAPWFLVAEAGIMDRGVIASELVACSTTWRVTAMLAKSPKTTCSAVESARRAAAARWSLRRMEDRVADMGEQFGHHQPEAVARTGEQYPCHPSSMVPAALVFAPGGAPWHLP
jgi:hypothetical protein